MLAFNILFFSLLFNSSLTCCQIKLHIVIFTLFDCICQYNINNKIEKQRVIHLSYLQDPFPFLFSVHGKNFYEYSEQGSLSYRHFLVTHTKADDRQLGNKQSRHEDFYSNILRSVHELGAQNIKPQKLSKYYFRIKETVSYANSKKLLLDSTFKSYMKFIYITFTIQYWKRKFRVGI